MEKYRQHSNLPRRNAQRNLSGRSHYADPDTLRYFNARILSAFDFADGLLFAVVQSMPQNHRNDKRGFRYRILDVAGNVLDRDGSDDFYGSSDAARRACRAHLAELDPIAVTRAAIDQLERGYSAEIVDMRRTMLPT